MLAGDSPDTSREHSGLSGSSSSPSKKPRAKKPKVGSSKKMTFSEQSERFKGTARKIESDETGKTFDKAIDAVLPAGSNNQNQ